MGAIGSFIMTPLYYVISFVLVTFHELFSLVMDPASGASWVLSIIFLTLVVRIALIPLFVKQIKSSRNMQLMQPKVAELRKKYGHDRERLAQETMKLYKDSGTNPFASCLPLLLQMPIFLALFHLLNGAANSEAKGFLDQTQASQFGEATLFGARIADTFIGTSLTEVRIFAAILVVAMTATTFLTQRQLMSKNMPPEALTGQFAQQQKLLLYVLPLVFGIGGIAFPIGVLFYWTTSNLWTMGQQFYVIRNNPAPNTPAADAKLERDKAKAERKAARGGVAPAPEPEPEVAPKPVDRQRQQPKKQSRSQRRSGSGNQPNRQQNQQPQQAQQSARRKKQPRPGPSEVPRDRTGGGATPEEKQ
ncbi:membrane protein insertase YidC [Nocardioidaceae bacterium]|nr:membrane protein insertase YidC [Nocardioidaceae bacterium]